MDKLEIPILADGDYTEWLFKMVENLNTMLEEDVSTKTLVMRMLTSLVRAEKEYNKLYEVFLTENYTLQDNRDKMEAFLIKYEEKLGLVMLHLIDILIKFEIKPHDIKDYYLDIIKDNNLEVLQGGKEPLNLSLQIGHWENYIISEVGWSLRGAFHIIPQIDILSFPEKTYIANKISNDSVYVMRIKKWDITTKLVSVLSAGSKAETNAKLMDLWGSFFNLLNYIDAKPVRLWDITLKSYNKTIEHHSS